MGYGQTFTMIARIHLTSDIISVHLMCNIFDILYRSKVFCSLLWALVQLDTTNAFNAADRSAAFGSIIGIQVASKPYDIGNVQPDNSILSFPELKPLFPYFKSMQYEQLIAFFQVRSHGCITQGPE